MFDVKASIDDVKTRVRMRVCQTYTIHAYFLLVLYVLVWSLVVFFSICQTIEWFLRALDERGKIEIQPHTNCSTTHFTCCRYSIFPKCVAVAAMAKKGRTVKTINQKHIIKSYSSSLRSCSMDAGNDSRFLLS